MPKILTLHGPNLNLLGAREPQHYGDAQLADIDRLLHEQAAIDNYAMECRQSNAESALIDWVQCAGDDGFDFILINPAAFTHTSIALRDALAAAAIPFIEVHLSNVYAREAFRHQSYFSDLAVGVVAGFGVHSYLFAYHAAVVHLRAQNDS